MPAFASTVTTATFTGGAGTVSSGGTLYAKQGGALTLTAITSSDTRCVDVAGAFTAHDQSAGAKTNWTFTTTAGAGDGAQGVTVFASPNVNAQGKCTGQTNSLQASFTLDNTGPVLTASLAPAANAAGWNKANVGITWSATDAGSGIGTGPTPATDSVSSNTAGVTKNATASDRLGNSGTGAVVVKLDKMNPTITGSAAPAANAAGWNNSDVTVSLTCADALSGIKSCTGGGTVVLSTEGANQSVSGTAVDNADNSASAGVTGISIDKTAPTLTGTPTTSPNGNGWYKGDVAIGWSGVDALSGINPSTQPANALITGEGSALTATASIADKAGNTRTASSAPVRVDRTPPVTGMSGSSNGWTNGSVTLVLSPSDNLSGVGSTSYAIDGGAVQSGTSVTLSSEGDHSISFFSTDRAGNVEAAQTAHVKIDTTAPTIGHSFTPLTYSEGAWSNQDVTVTFACADAGSGVASCTAPVTQSSEGLAQQVTGTATDNAGNSASDTAVVSIDKTAPTVSASADRAPNGAGWYRDAVTVSFSANDALSGLASASPSQIVGEGANQSVTGSAMDGAGNSASAGVSGINVDTTAPVLAAVFSPGWHNDDVTVLWSCTDALSGVAGGPADDTVTGEGGNLASSATCTDVAGNTASSTVDGIQIDRTAPTTTATVPDPLPSGWYADAVQVALTGHDALSGVAATYYRIDGAAAQPYAGSFSFTQKGTHTIAFWSTDVAGNSEDATVNSITLKIDDVPPVTTVINPISPASGWFVMSGIPVAFDADDAESGIAATYYEIDGGEAQTYGVPFTAELATGSHSITYWSVDLAGNAEAKRTTIVNVDDVAPSIVGVGSPAANGFGWNNTDVDVTFTCTDAESGVAGCGPDGTVSTEGADQQVQGDTQDVAGNVNSTTVDHINIDKTAPTLVGNATSDANGAGWYNGDVTIEWTGYDALSGIDPATQPADDTISGEGTDLGASAGIFDRAGNKTTASVSGIDIDRTAPHIEGGPTTTPNAAGWYRDQVVLDFTCTDALSGVASCPTSEVISGDGAGQAVTSDPAGDKAGNLSVGKTVGGINIDGSAPSTTANNQCTKTNGWCTGASANVVLTATDQAGLSGVKEIHYRIDGGAEQVAAGAAKTVSVPLDGSGTGTVLYWAVDIAGNTEASNAVALKWDNIAPMVTHTLSPVPNANDWNTSDVTVTFGAKDDDAGSGVADVTGPVTVSTATDGQLLIGSATDTAGNVGTDTVTVKLDKTAPTISGGVVSGTQGANGWYVGAVTVHFTCGDDRSGVATCPDDVILTSNGANSAGGTATDKAGNTAVTAVSGINIDTEAPTITAVNLAGGTYTLGAVPAASCTAGDGFSGLAGSCVVTISGGTPNGVGTFSYTARATDTAGNTATTTGTYRVIYRFDGFLQPINDTAHQVGTSTSVFKGGSTIPVKLQLKNAGGTLVQANAAPVWLTPAKGASMSLPVDESTYAVAADSGSTYRAEGSQYGYNWKTPSGGNYYRVGVRLDDGQTYFVNIGLR
ncbi:OmpL47-type beta-barrel domain-containing protein [Agromyces humi]|uniref:OmpL47-type beta-barrel domain-containing protein n=1 Tax=Agromyces humi TaxID=1766800 RepID=UPI00135A9A55|nr:PxKF domain-containing protein [Agromyces humi]